MSQENLESLRRSMEAVNRRDPAAFMVVCDPELENVPPRDWPEPDVTKGREAVWAFYVAGNEPWGEGTFEPVELLDAGNDTIVTHVQGDMRGTASGAGVRWSYWAVVSFRGGKVLRVEWFAARAEALEAAGLRE